MLYFPSRFLWGEMLFYGKTNGYIKEYNAKFWSFLKIKCKKRSNTTKSIPLVKGCNTESSRFILLKLYGPCVSPVGRVGSMGVRPG